MIETENARGVARDEYIASYFKKCKTILTPTVSQEIYSQDILLQLVRTLLKMPSFQLELKRIIPNGNKYNVRIKETASESIIVIYPPKELSEEQYRSWYGLMDTNLNRFFTTQKTGGLQRTFINVEEKECIFLGYISIPGWKIKPNNKIKNNSSERDNKLKKNEIKMDTNSNLDSDSDSELDYRSKMELQRKARKNKIKQPLYYSDDSD